jgi:hypothetical protein
MAKELKRRGFRFVGPTTAYALMQATGMVDDHLAGCHVVPRLSRGVVMDPCGCWAGVVGEDAYARERLYARDAVELSPGGTEEPAPGDAVLLVAALGETPVLFGLGRVRLAYAAAVSVAYTHRLFDEPQPVDLDAAGGTAPRPGGRTTSAWPPG